MVEQNNERQITQLRHLPSAFTTEVKTDACFGASKRSGRERLGWTDHLGRHADRRYVPTVPDRPSEESERAFFCSILAPVVNAQITRQQTLPDQDTF